MVTRAEKISSGHELNGVKTWISNAPAAGVALDAASLDGDGHVRNDNAPWSYI